MRLTYRSYRIMSQVKPCPKSVFGMEKPGTFFLCVQKAKTIYFFWWNCPVIFFLLRRRLFTSRGWYIARNSDTLEILKFLYICIVNDVFENDLFYGLKTGICHYLKNLNLDKIQDWAQIVSCWSYLFPHAVGLPAAIILSIDAWANLPFSHNSESSFSTIFLSSYSSAIFPLYSSPPQLISNSVIYLMIEYWFKSASCGGPIDQNLLTRVPFFPWLSVKVNCDSMICQPSRNSLNPP